MIDTLEAIRFAQERFPYGPEELAKHLQIPVHYVPLVGCDGWCVRRGNRAIIRINKSVPLVRQRFTLAHELLHIASDTETDISDFEDGSFLGESGEEVINNLSSAMLLPKEQLHARISSAPVTRKEIEAISRDGHVSDVAVVRRIVRLSEDFRLRHAYVACFRDSKFQWMHPKWATSTSVLIELASKAAATQPHPHVRETLSGVETSLVFHTPYSDTLFVQVT